MTNPAATRPRETELHRLWLEQRFPPGALYTVAGAPVRVLYRGRPGGGAGPDFRDARISVGGAPPRLGDVELHVIAADFRRHGHLTDAAYGRVLLHVVFDGGGETETALPGGGVAPVVALRPWVERRSAELRAWLERSSPWREPCHSAIARQGVPAVRGLLAAEGLARLQAKAAVCARTVADIGADETLYRALCSALGLNRNVEPFDILARRLFAGDLLSETSYLSAVEAEAMIRARLHTVAGFGVEAPPLGALPWRLDGIRPGAHPTKRLDALATLLVRHRAGLARELRRASHSGGRALLRAVQAPGIGRDRAVEIAINGVLPWLIATGDERVACDLATTLPAAAPYGVLVTLSTALTDPHPTTSAPSRSLVAAGALAQQGALALHHGWCRRGGCGVCPLS